MLANRLRKTFRHLGKWARRNEITCFRIYEKDNPEHPLIVDWYDGKALAYALERKRDENEEERAEWLAMAEEAILEGLDITADSLFFKERERQRGSAQHRKLADRRAEFLIEESGHRFIVNLSDYLDTGLFLDHRNLRKRVQSEAEGKRMLNLFAYTGSFTVYAAKGGASRTTTVDLSNSYLAWAERNFELNELDPAKHKTERADVLDWLPRALELKNRYDLIVCDPPTFSNSKKMTGYFDVQEHHPELIDACLRLLSPDGVLYFSTNYRNFKLREDRLLPCLLQEISDRTIPLDFRNKRIHRCWRFRLENKADAE